MCSKHIGKLASSQVLPVFNVTRKNGTEQKNCWGGPGDEAIGKSTDTKTKSGNKLYFWSVSYVNWPVTAHLGQFPM